MMMGGTTTPGPWTRWLIRGLALCLIAVTTAAGMAGTVETGRNPLSVSVKDARLPPLIGHLETVTDDEARLTIKDVAFGPAADRFVPIPGKFSGGYSASAAFWIRFAVTMPPEGLPEPLLLDVEPPFLDDVRVFVPRIAAPRTADDFAVSVIGDEHPFLERAIIVPSLLVPINLPSGTTSIVYIRMQTTSAALLNPALVTVSQAMTDSAKRNLLFGALYGSAALIAVINFLFWVWLRERMYLLYSLYALTATLLYPTAQGSTAFLLQSSFHEYSYYLEGELLSFHILFGTLFAVTILGVRRTIPWVFWISMVVCAGAVTGMIATAFRQWTIVAAPIFLSTMLSQAAILYASVRLSVRGDVAARLYLIAFVPLIVVIITVALRNIGMLESLPLGEHSVEIAIQTHLVMMTIGLASRVHRSEQERRKAQAQALEVSRNAEREANTLVAERTRELVAAKTTLERTLAKEQQFSRQQVQFVDMISHEFRTPLAILQDAHTTLSNGLPTIDPTTALDLTRMSQALDRLKEVLEVGLQRERIDTGRMKARFVACGILYLVRAAVETTSSAHPGRIIRSDGAEDWSDLTVLGDFALLKTALVNLLDNAAKYSPADRPIEIRIQSLPTTADMAEAFAITVSDQGRGISEAQQQHVFEKYYRAPGSIDQPGAGLGLHLVQRILEMHDGAVSLVSRTGGGTTVSLIIPRYPAQDESTASSAHP